jgi:hypothetical protein
MNAQPSGEVVFYRSIAGGGAVLEIRSELPTGA